MRGGGGSTCQTLLLVNISVNDLDITHTHLCRDEKNCSGRYCVFDKICRSRGYNLLLQKGGGEACELGAKRAREGLSVIVMGGLLLSLRSSLTSSQPKKRVEEG